VKIGTIEQDRVGKIDARIVERRRAASVLQPCPIAASSRVAIRGTRTR
jgi:hypothetical protein